MEKVTQGIAKMFNTVSVTLGGVGAVVGLFCSPENQVLFYLLLLAMVLDLGTGTTISLFRHATDSKMFRLGVCRKVATICLILFSYQLDNYANTGGSVASKAILLFYLANEVLSLVENSAILGVPIPDKLKVALVQVRKNASKGIDIAKDGVADGITKVVTAKVDRVVDTTLGEDGKELKESLDSAIKDTVDTVTDVVVDTAINATTGINDVQPEEIKVEQSKIDSQPEIEIK